MSSKRPFYPLPLVGRDHHHSDIQLFDACLPACVFGGGEVLLSSALLFFLFLGVFERTKLHTYHRSLLRPCIVERGFAVRAAHGVSKRAGGGKRKKNSGTEGKEGGM